MDNIKNIITGGIVTLVVGGTVFSFSQQDVIDNFADDTGVSQEQAEQYVNSVTDEDMVSFTEVGLDYLSESEVTLEGSNSIDCENYEYEWESPTLSCATGKSQSLKIANSERLLGEAYIKLDSDTVTEAEINEVIKYLDQLNTDYKLEIAIASFDNDVLNEMLMTNSYNKSLLKAALESE